MAILGTLFTVIGIAMMIDGKRTGFFVAPIFALITVKNLMALKRR